MKQKSLTLEQTWSRCLAMWRWIVAEYKRNPDSSVETLKQIWLNKHYPKTFLSRNCYFCDWSRTYSKSSITNMCRQCPGKQVDPQFYCMDSSYDYGNYSTAFLRKLEQLNRKRKEIKHNG